MSEKKNLWRLALNTIMNPVQGYKSEHVKHVGESLKVSEHGSDNVRYAVGEMILKVAHLKAFAELVYSDEVLDDD